MEQQEERVIDEFLASAKSLANHTQEVEKMLVQTLEVLAKLDNRSRFNPVTILQEGHQRRKALDESAERIGQHVGQMEELVRTSALITTSLEINRVLEDVIDTVIHLTGAERAFLMMVSSGSDDLTVRAARNANKEDIDLADVTFSRGVIKAALDEKKPIISTNVQEDERFQAMQSVMRHDLRSIMVIPMLLQDVPLGVLYLDNRLAKAVFHKKSVPVLTAFANQAAISIENARLFERVQESLARTRREVKRLRIQLDQQKVQTQAMEITGSDYFQELAAFAKSMRERGSESGEEDNSEA